MERKYCFMFNTKEEVMTEVKGIIRKLNNLEEEKRILSNNREITRSKGEKRSKIILFSTIGLFFLCAFLGGVTQIAFFGYATVLVACIGVIVFYLSTRFIEMDDKGYIKAISNKDQEITEQISKKEELNPKWRDFVIQELCMRFGITPTQFEYDLTPILYQHPELKEWWMEQERIDVVIEALTRKYKRTYNELEKSDLEVENLKLRNEGIAIDNTQKKFWTCQFCGNMNRADDMSCIKCGGVRPSIE